MTSRGDSFRRILLS